MRRLLFFLRAYPQAVRFQVFRLLIAGLIYPAGKVAQKFPQYLIESRRILGFVFDRDGMAVPAAETMRIEFRLNGRMVQLDLRWNTSDFRVFEQVFVYGEYRAAIGLCEGLTPSVVIDAGANIGCASIFLHSYFPDASILALEADAANVKQLATNLRLSGIQSAVAVHRGLWYRSGRGEINHDHRDNREWSLRLIERSDGPVVVNTLRSLLEEFKISGSCVLKIDIEGAEAAIFRQDETLDSALSVIDIIAMEIHDPEDCVMIKARLVQNGFQCRLEGQTMFGVKKPRK